MEPQRKHVEWVIFGDPPQEGVYTIMGLGNVFIPQDALDTVARQGAPYFGAEVTEEPTGGAAQWRVTQLIYDAFDPA